MLTANKEMLAVGLFASAQMAEGAPVPSRALSTEIDQNTPRGLHQTCDQLWGGLTIEDMGMPVCHKWAAKPAEDITEGQTVGEGESIISRSISRPDNMKLSVVAVGNNPLEGCQDEAWAHPHGYIGECRPPHVKGKTYWELMHMEKDEVCPDDHTLIIAQNRPRPGHDDKHALCYCETFHHPLINTPEDIQNLQKGGGIDMCMRIEEKWDSRKGMLAPVTACYEPHADYPAVGHQDGGGLTFDGCRSDMVACKYAKEEHFDKIKGDTWDQKPPDECEFWCGNPCKQNGIGGLQVALQCSNECIDSNGNLCIDPSIKVVDEIALPLVGCGATVTYRRQLHDEGGSAPERRKLSEPVRISNVYAPGVKHVGESAFAAISGLELLDFPEVESVAKESFASSVAAGGTSTPPPFKIKMPKLKFIGKAAFARSDIWEARKLSMPEVIEVGDDAFAGWRSLRQVSLPKAKHIGDLAFFQKNEGELKDVDMPMVTSVGKGAFMSSSELKSIHMPHLHTVGALAFFSSALTHLDLPSVKTVGEKAFENCPDLTHVSMPNVETAHKESFQECNKLASINMPRLRHVGELAFQYDALTSLDLPSVTYVGDDAFEENKKLTRVSMPNVEYIGDEGFDECYDLASIHMPRLKRMGESAFEDAALTSLDLPSVTYVGKEAFQDCVSLTHVSMANVEVLAEEAFDDCEKLESIHMPRLRKIGYEGFEDCNLKSVDLPSLEFLGEEGFQDNKKLTSVNMPRLLKIGEDAFDDCDLTSVYFPLVTHVGDYAFDDNERLTRVHLPNVQEISSSAFDECDKLSCVILPPQFTLIKHETIFADEFLCESCVGGQKALQCSA